MGTLFERMTRLAAQGRNPDPIDTSTLGPIKHDPNAGHPWASPAECAADLRSMAKESQNGHSLIMTTKLHALARLMDNWADRPADFCVSNF